jgi:tetratricopeptide (TPR) repeat protein
MKPSYFYTIMLSLMIAFTASAADYFEHITVFSDGKITRFTRMPITVYIDPSPGGEPYLPDLRYAIGEWETATAGKLRFQEITEPDDADIRVTWQSRGLTQITDTKLGRAELTRLSDTDFEVEVLLSLRDEGGAAAISNEKMRTACLHEFGHALGLWGHSPDADDMLFFASNAQKPTARDSATLIRVYETPLHTPQHDDAIRVLKAELDANPNHPRNRYLLGAVYFDKGDFDAAISSFKACLELDPNFQQASTKLLQAYQKTGRRQEAIDLLETTLDRETSPEGYNAAGVMYYQNRELDKAMDAFKKALQLNPRYRPAKGNLHNLYLEKGVAALKTETYPQAITYFSSAVQLNPTDTIAYKLIGEAYSKSGDFSTAIVHYKKAVQLNPGDTEATQNLAWSYNNLGVAQTRTRRWNEAIEAYTHALELMPNADIRTNRVDAYWKRANFYRDAGRLDQAIEAYRALLQVEPNATDIHSLLGDLHLRKGEYPQAIAEFHAAVEASPDDTQAKQNLIAVYHKYGQVLQGQRRYGEAIEQLQRGLALEPEHINLRLNLAVIYQRTNDFEAATAEFAKILEIEPEHSQAKEGLVNLRIRRGNAFLQRKKYTAALKEFEGIPKSARNAGIYNTIGYLYLMKKQPMKAIPAFDAALADDPMDDVAYQNLRSIESQLDRQLDKADDVEPVKNNLARVRNSLTICLIGRNKHLEAKRKYRFALDLAPTHTEVKAALINTGILLVREFKKKQWPKNMKEVSRWIQEFDPENPEVKRLLDGIP